MSLSLSDIQQIDKVRDALRDLKQKFDEKNELLEGISRKIHKVAESIESIETQQDMQSRNTTLLLSKVIENQEKMIERPIKIYGADFLSRVF